MATRFQTYAKQVKLLPGQQLKFTSGRGYYAGPGAAPAPYAGGGPAEPKSGNGGNPYVPTVTVRVPAKRPGGPTAAPIAPVDPFGPSNPDSIAARAAAEAQGQLDPQLAEVRRQQALAAAQAKGDEAAITGFQTAAGGLMGQIPGAISGAYDAAGRGIGALGAGVGGAVGDDLHAATAAADEFAASQGQSGGSTLNGEEGNVISYLGGVIPGTQFEQEGAGRAAAAAEAVKIPLNAGREELASRMVQARTTNDGYAQQLIEIASKYPALKAQALQQLNDYEISKANYRETRRVNTANIANAKADNRRQEKALADNEKLAGIKAAADTAYKHDESAYRWASLDFKTKQAAASAKAAAAKGKRIDTQASKLLGHLVYKDGTEDTSIKVKQTTSATDPTVKAKQNRAKAVQTARTAAFKTAKTTLGTPTMTDKDTLTIARSKGVRIGRYIAAPSEKYGVPGGVFPPPMPGMPATTNDITRSTRKGGATNYGQAQAQVWASIAGDSLVSRYGLSHEQVMAYVNAALKAAGWKR